MIHVSGRLLPIAIALTTGFVVPGIAEECICANVTGLNNKPLSGATVTATHLFDPTFRRSADTDIEGRVCFQELAEGLYSVEVGRAGYLRVRYYPVRYRFPTTTELHFQMPFGEILEAGLMEEAVFSGTLRQSGTALAHAEICLVGVTSKTRGCTTSNGIGQYALVVSPGRYWVELNVGSRRLLREELNLPAPGYYVDRIRLPAKGRNRK